MLLATREQAYLIDKKSQEIPGVSATSLMEEAGVACTKQLLKDFPHEVKNSVTVFCGPGNNGGDGKVIARKLLEQGLKNVEVVEVAKKTEFSVPNQGLLIDAIFGIGLSRNIEEPLKTLIKKINSSGQKILSIDCPSGLDCNSGKILGVAVRASMTYAIGISKPGFYIREGVDCAGSIKVLPISFPPEIIKEIATTHDLFNAEDFKSSLPERKSVANKSNFGRALIIAGSEGKWGASVLACRAAFRVGAGYVVHMSFDNNSSSLLSAVPEVMTEKPENLAKMIKDFRDKGLSVAVGPGLGVSRSTADLIQILVKEKVQNVVLDADAITAATQFDLFPLPTSWILTPHSGELSRALKVSNEELEKDPVHFAGIATKELGSTILLKGSKTIIARDEKRTIINAGNSALAKAGSGDVLTGMIAGFMAQGLQAVEAGKAAAYLHGKIADNWILQKDQSTLTASDLIEEIPTTFGKLR